MKIIKVPFDRGIYEHERRGTRFAPDKLAKGKNLLVSEDFAATNEAIYSAVANSVGEKVLLVGGDHSITYSAFRAFKEKYEDSCIVILDAHSDCEQDFIPPSHEGVTRAIATSLTSPKDILLVGYRKAHTTEEREFIKKNKIKTITSEEINNKTIDKIKEFVKDYKYFYLSIDIDVFDPKDAPGTGWPEQGGADRSILLNIIKQLNKSEKLKNVDLVEVSPPKDISRKTVALASEIIKELISPKG